MCRWTPRTGWRVEVPVADHEGAVDDDMLHALGHLARVRERRLVSNRLGVEHDDIGVHPLLQAALRLHCGDAILENQAGVERRPTDGVHPADHLTFADPLAQESAVVAGHAWVVGEVLAQRPLVTPVEAAVWVHPRAGGRRLLPAMVAAGAVLQTALLVVVASRGVSWIVYGQLAAMALLAPALASTTVVRRRATAGSRHW